ncbi:hypothetical protein O166_05710 [Pseudogulbenkiania ferrooxidans EGD-HP2]|uniref:Uncharacterized protein n=1 Tax=Pseudogulbenkiania ferrooxidans EGD-HP2 TaxID=1388764 RepID=A0ABP2XPD4_9NEIS|nr:hypothetical protein O166_05710 [Pseudogulbenkiania ferrooxidans EGD-HP2]
MRRAISSLMPNWATSSAARCRTLLAITVLRLRSCAALETR